VGFASLIFTIKTAAATGKRAGMNPGHFSPPPSGRLEPPDLVRSVNRSDDRCFPTLSLPNRCIFSRAAGIWLPTNTFGVPRIAMAKSSKKPVARSTPASEAEGWLTAAERKLLDGTLGQTLARASQKQLQATIARARMLRDKWRDLFARQMKSAKRSISRGETVNSRSLDKAELFAAAVRRVEARLGELLAGAAPAPGRKPATTASAAKLSKASRTAGHRGTRAAVRKSLATAAEAGPKATRKKAASKKASVKKAASKKPTTKKAKPAATKTATATDRTAAKQTTSGATAGTRASGKAASSASSKKARQAGTRKTAAAATGVVGYDRKKQRSAKASATAARIKFDGLSTRRRGHTLVAGKRRQARRDGR